MSDTERYFWEKVGYPNDRSFFKLIERQYFQNFPITIEDNNHEMHIYGQDVNETKGKCTRGTPERARNITTMQIPQTIKYIHPKVTLSMDNFFLQVIDFLNNISSGYKYHTVRWL